MKIAVTSTGPTLDDNVEARFGRCPYFLIIDTETMQLEAIENPNMALGGGAGIQSAQLLANHQVQVVLTGNCGPNAFATLGAAEIQVIVGVGGTIRQAMEQFKSGAFSGASGPNVASHFGMTTENQTGASTAPPIPTVGGMDSRSGVGSGSGMGMGRGMGRGQGMGRGMGQGGGGGRGMGMGGGRGGGRGMGMGSGAMVPPSGPVQTGGLMPQQTAGPARSEEELEILKTQAQEMNAQLKAVNDRIGQVESGGSVSALVAAVDADKCTTCGVCQPVCPTGAISLGGIAQIDQEKCTACGRCVAECPQGAIILKKAS